MDKSKSFLLLLMMALGLWGCSSADSGKQQAEETEPKKEEANKETFKKAYEDKIAEDLHLALASADTEGEDSILDGFFTENTKYTPLEEIKKSAKDHIQKLQESADHLQGLNKVIEQENRKIPKTASKRMSGITGNLKDSLENQIEVLLFFKETRTDTDRSIDDYLAEAEEQHEKAEQGIKELEKEHDFQYKKKE